jgi:hypothetical protein
VLGDRASQGDSQRPEAALPWGSCQTHAHEVERRISGVLQTLAAR